ncbi:MAG: hypothetical protein AAF432_06285 [Planctomycetota bacterium]
MRNMLSVVVLIAMVIGLDQGLRGPDGAPGDLSSSTQSTLTTLYAHDPVQRSLSVNSGEPGMVMRPEGVFNRDTDIDFHSYRPGELSFGMQGGSQAHITDLGSQRALADRYGYEETVGFGQGFASIQVANGTVMIRGREDDQSLQPLVEADMLLNAFDRTQSSILPEVGHVYLLRLIEDRSTSIVKILVVAYRERESVTFRWERIDD